MKRIDEAAARAASSLRDDWTLRQETEQELKLHLEESAENLGSEEEALAHFGDPEEVGRELLAANFRKMRLRSKLKLAMRIAAVPLLLLAFVVTIDFNSFAALNRLNNEFDFLKNSSGATFNQTFLKFTEIGRRVMGEPSLSEEERLFFSEGKTKQETLKMRRLLAERHLRNPVYRANYAVLLYVYPRPQESELTEELRKLVRQEPGNALYSYLLVREEMAQSAVIPPKESGLDQLEIKDRAGFERAITDFLAATGKPYCSDYMPQRLEVINAIFPGKDFHSRLRRLEAMAGLYLPQYNNYRYVGRMTAAYAHLLVQEGKHEEAEKLMDNAIPFARHLILESNTMIGLLVSSSILQVYGKEYPALYETIGKPEKGRQLTEVATAIHRPVDQFRQNQKKSWTPKTYRSAGWFTKLISAFPDGATSSVLKTDRAISYCAGDSVVIFFFGCVVTGIILILTGLWCVMRFLFKRRGEFLFLTRRSYLRLLGWGVAAPLGCYLLWIHIDSWSGRGTALGYNGLFFLSALVLLVIVPLIFDNVLFRLLRNRYRALTGECKAKLPYMSYLTSVIPCWVVYLLIAGTVLSFVNRIELRKHLDDADFFNGNGFSRTEDRWIGESRAYMIRQIDTRKE